MIWKVLGFLTTMITLCIGKLFRRRMVIDQYINKVLVYSDKIEVYMNLMSDYMVKETIKQ